MRDWVQGIGLLVSFIAIIWFVVHGSSEDWR